MTFVRKKANLTPIVDNVFRIVKLAAQDKEKNGSENVIDATIGSLCDEQGKLVAFDSVFNHYDTIDHRTKAKYAASFRGNNDYLEAVYKWVTQNTKIKLNHQVLATVGGTGAISMCISNILDTNQTLIVPNIAWGSYKLMAQQYNLNVETYEMFDNDNNFNLKSFKETILKIAKIQDKLLVVINDPCHNPTGLSLEINTWKEIIDFINDISKEIPCVILNDIAYIDYAYDLVNSRKYMEVFNNISDNVMINIAFSCSKSVTSYGLRCGACIILANKQESVDEVSIVYEKSARSVWSNIPNAAMENFTWLVNNPKEYIDEKAKYIDLLHKRADTFITQANQCGLPLYPYNEGFFVTIKVNDNHTRDILHQRLMDNHIYTVAVNLGIRIAICSLPLDKADGLAYKISEIFKTLP